MSATNVPMSSNAYGVVIKKVTNAAEPARRTVGAKRIAAATVKSCQSPPARSLQTHKKVSASGARIGATDTFGAMARPTSAPSNTPSRMRPESMKRSIAHRDAKDARTVNGSGR